VRAEGLGHAPQEGQVALEDAIPEVDRAGVEVRHLGRELERGETFVAHRPAARGAAREVDDRLAARLAQLLHEDPVGLAILTRIYFADEEKANAADPLLAGIADPRARGTLLAAQAPDGYRFDVCLQGPDETVFLAL